MTTNLTRRSALAGAAALPLAPAAAIAQSTALDPVLAALPALEARRAEHLRLAAAFADYEREHGPADQGPEIDAAVGRLVDAEKAIADLVPTTLPGVAAQLRVLAASEMWDQPGTQDQTGARFVASLIRAVERIAGVAS